MPPERRRSYPIPQAPIPFRDKSLDIRTSAVAAVVRGREI